MTRTEESAVSTHPSPTVLLACELSERTWKLGFATGLGQRSRVRSIAADTVDRLVEDIARAKVRLHVPADTPVVSGYEAGRDGFWLHRYLVAHGITNHVVDSSSIEVNRRARRAKTDRLDLEGLLVALGVRLPVGPAFLTRVAAAWLWDGMPLPTGIVDRLTRVWTQLHGLNQQL